MSWLIQMVQARVKCKESEALTALSIRDNVPEFAVEYLQCRDLPMAMDESERYPKWFQYLEQKRRRE